MSIGDSKYSYIHADRHNWLLACAAIVDNIMVVVHPRGDLTKAAGQAAVDAQYPEMNLRVGEHGNQFYVCRRAVW